MRSSADLFGGREEKHGPLPSQILEMMKRGVKKKRGTREGEAFIRRSR